MRRCANEYLITMTALYHILAGLVRAIDTLIQLGGRAVAWLALAMIIINATIVILRYGLGNGSIALQESMIYLHASLFLLSSAWVLQADGHVRVDVFYRNMSARQRAWVNSLGALLFTMPVAATILWVSWDYVAQSWHIQEHSTEADGLPGVFLLKTLIPVFAVSLFLQALAEALRACLVLVGYQESKHA